MRTLRGVKVNTEGSEPVATQAIETPQPLTVDVPTAATLLGISQSHAFALAARGELPGAMRLGSRVVVSRRVLEQAVNGEADD